MIPMWFSNPYKVMSEKDKIEALEYEQVQLEMAESEFLESMGEKGTKLYLNLVHAELRVKQLEESIK